MSLADAMKADAISVFMNPADFAESVVYTPANDGTPRTILVLIDRNPPVQMDKSGQLFQPKIEIQVINDSVKGIASNDDRAVGGTISIPLNLGGTAVPLPIRTMKVQKQDPGVVHITLT